jgi:hypothetical protein
VLFCWLKRVRTMRRLWLLASLPPEWKQEGMVLKAAEIRKLIPELFRLVQQLEACAEGRPFTPDGHMGGSIGEVLAASEYGLRLQDPRNKGFDAIHEPSGKEVEIKATFGKSGCLAQLPSTSAGNGPRPHDRQLQDGVQRTRVDRLEGTTRQRASGPH